MPNYSADLESFALYLFSAAVALATEGTNCRGLDWSSTDARRHGAITRRLQRLQQTDDAVPRFRRHAVEAPALSILLDESQTFYV